ELCCSFLSATLVAILFFCFFAFRCAGIRDFMSVFMRRPCAGQHLLFFAAAKKSRQKKAAFEPPVPAKIALRHAAVGLRAATSAPRRKPAVNRAQRENPRHSLEHIPPQSNRWQTPAGRMCSKWMSSFAPRAPHYGLSTECLHRCAIAQLRHAEA